ncbi:MAG: ATP synthase F1 subunit epsilon [Polyangiaceae bacterium]|jgi:F-type H+-transporting ATPase subunit epsilon
MVDQIELEIVTPRGRALRATVDEVTAPSVGGEFGVLPGHVPLLAALRAGIVTYRKAGEAKRCGVGAGFVEVGSDRVVILTDEYAEREQVDPVITNAELSDVQRELRGIDGVAIATSGVGGVGAADQKARVHRDLLIARENWLATKLELYGYPPSATTLAEYAAPPAKTDDEEDSGDGGASSSAHSAVGQSPDVK